MISSYIDPAFFDDEGNNEYHQGGYCPVKVKEIINNRYEVVGKCGWGHYSTVWLCVDTHAFNKDKRNKKYVALKIVKSSTNYTKGFICSLNIKNVMLQLQKRR
jgi:serine/threonine protein kinase